MRDLQTRGNNSGYQDVFEEFDRMIDGFFGRPVARQINPQSNAFLPPYEVKENEQGYLLSFDLPGVPREDIKIELKDQQLRVSGERRQTEETAEKQGRVYSERRYGRFERMFTLPADVDGDKIQAQYEMGELHLMLPKTEKVKARNIEINTGGTGGFFSKLVGNKKNDVQ